MGIILAPWKYPYKECSICGSKIYYSSKHEKFWNGATPICDRCNTTFQGGPLDGQKVGDVISNYIRIMKR